MNRDETIKAIKAALQKRSGKQWSVTGGRGTAWGWIKIEAPPSRCTWSHRLKAGERADIPANYEEYDTGEPGRSMGPQDRAELAQLMGLEKVHDYISIASSNDYYQEYTERAQGLVPSAIAQPYWD